MDLSFYVSFPTRINRVIFLYFPFYHNTPTGSIPKAFLTLYLESCKKAVFKLYSDDYFLSRTLANVGTRHVSEKGGVFAIGEPIPSLPHAQHKMSICATNRTFQDKCYLSFALNQVVK